MPKYEITLSDGRKLQVEADKPPSEQDVMAYLSKQPDAPKAETPAAPAERTWGDTAKDVAIGVAKGAGNTAFGLGKIVHDYTPIGRISDAIHPGAFNERPPELTPTNTPQRVGFTGEQVAEFFLPAGAAGKVGKAAEVAKSAGLTLAQSGSPTSAGVSGLVTAAMPGASALKRGASALNASAQQAMAQALGATKEWAKAEAAKLAPEMLKRGIGGSRQAMLATAKEAAKRIGQNLDDAYKAAAASGEVVPSAIIQGNLQLAADALKVADPTGALRVIPGTERVIQKLDELGAFVASYGDDIPVDKAAHIKRTWDRIVSKSGLFGPKATATATDNADAWAVREASNSFRQLLNTNPDIAALNAESAFWTGLKNVLKETEKRTQSQRGGLTDSIRGVGGAVAGAAVGGPVGAGIGQFATQTLSKAIQSPAFKTRVSGPLKQQLADALASGSAAKVAAVSQRILAAAPAQIRAASVQ